MRLTVLIFCCALTFGQNTSSAPETKSQAPVNSTEQKSRSDHSDMSARVRVQQAVLANTQGVDGPYLMQVIGEVYERWNRLIPESVRIRTGKLAIAFEISKDGNVGNVRLVASSGDAALDCSAWKSITGSNPFPPLPGGFTGQSLPLRLPFYYNLDATDNEWDDLPSLSVSKSAVRVSISAPGNLQIPVGGSQVVTAIVTGTNEKGVEWRITGPGCSASTLGNVVGDLYIAPRMLSHPAVVTLTAFAKVDHTAKASITVHIIQSAAQMSSKP